MQKEKIVYIKKLMLLGVLFLTEQVLAEEVINPYAVNNGAIPSKKEYSGSFFKFKYDYPKKSPQTKEMPWTKVLNGKPLTKENTYQYIMELKKYVTNPMKIFVLKPQEWNQWFQNRWGNISQSKEKGSMALDYSTFLEAVFMNYAVANFTDNLNDKNIFSKYRTYRNFRNHYEEK
jgi:hypothetical protein